MAFEIIVSLLGIFFNALVILTICRNKYRLSASSYLVLSIAVSDFLCCSVAVPFSITRHFQQRWPFGLASCQAHAFIIFLHVLVSLSHLSAISAGKYLSITKSVCRQSYFSMKTVIIVVWTSWVCSFTLSVAPLIRWSRIYGLQGFQGTCSNGHEPLFPGEEEYFGILFFVCFILALAVITFCYYEIHKTCKNIVFKTPRGGGLLAMRAIKALLRKHQRSAMYFSVVIASFMLTWSPYAVVSLLTVLRLELTPIGISACSALAKSSFFLNPLLYAIQSRRFRKRMISVVPVNRQKRLAGAAGVVSTSVGPLAL